MLATLGPLAESAFALYLFGRNGDVAFHEWRRTVRAELGRDAARFMALSQQFRTLEELPEAFADAFTSGADPDQIAPGEERNGTRLLAELCRVAVLPHWSLIRGHLDGARDGWGRVAIAHGVERLLSSLHPKVRWRAPVLEVRHGPHRDIHLDGRGLLLCPSFFLSEQSCAFVPAVGREAMPVLVYPVKISSRGDIWGTPEHDEQALGALVGHTRAAALEALTEGCSTGELAERLGISLAGASKHAAVLRRSGLVTTSRNRNTALHALTPLGTALLRHSGGDSLPARSPVPLPIVPPQRMRSMPFKRVSPGADRQAV
ncbi:MULTISPECIES: winged helix-turn-helix domain-containing protein [unclassified Streptomyces]|uniref:ArsR/SmtB family transcription factor n=1 Tax=unclassified Streptomyces TaxID=2593676 RepID=UPI000379DBE8|nr:MULTISPECIES: winged helix-turn-helix domain-containing protein [unclassified Streptomyces]MYT28844.1 helix-turn-helix domain-containing protein [Streptomyces sp. SID8354]